MLEKLVEQFYGPEIGNVSGKFLIQDWHMSIERINDNFVGLSQGKMFLVLSPSDIGKFTPVGGFGGRKLPISVFYNKHVLPAWLSLVSQKPMGSNGLNKYALNWSKKEFH
jgi:hypothetical protein